MKTVLVEEDSEERRAYDSLLLDPKHLGIFNSPLSVRVVQQLSKQPGCALDLARSLGEHEQKIYYHLRKLETAGIVRLLRNEKRFGMTAKIYDVVSPVVAAKLYDDGAVMKKTVALRPSLKQLLSPFINNGKFDALVIIGDTYSHGKFDMYSTEGAHAFDLAFLLGSFTADITFPNYKFDTEVTDEDMERNLILIGHPQTNAVIEMVNDKLPVFFDEKDDWAISRREGGEKMRDPRDGIIVKMTSPFNPSRKIIVFGGRTRGTHAAILAFTKFIERIETKIKDMDKFHIVVQGFDRNADKVIDDIKVME